MKKMNLVFVAVGILAVIGLLYFSLFSNPGEVPRQKPVKVVKEQRPRLKKDGAALSERQDEFRRKIKTAKNLRNIRRPNIDILTIRSDISEQDRRTMKTVQEALDSEDYDKLLSVLPKIRSSSNAELRGDFVNALGWFGTEGMLELLPFIADPDEDVANSASGHWEMALNKVDSDGDKCMLVESAMAVIKNRDLLDTMAQELVSCDEVEALQVLVNLIEGPNPVAADVAMEQYEFITDEKYAGVEAAEEWLENNYVPEDDDN